MVLMNIFLLVYSITVEFNQNSKQKPIFKIAKTLPTLEKSIQDFLKLMSIFYSMKNNT